MFKFWKGRGRRSRLGMIIVAALFALVPTALAAQAATSLTVADGQALGPAEISVAGAAHTEPFYIVIHEGDASSFGGVIGSSDLLPAGAVSNHAVSLTRDLVDGEYLWPMLHVDGNGNNVYDDPSTDPPVVDAGVGNASFGGVMVFPMQVSAVQTTQPAPADTGNAGLAATDGSSGTMLLLVLAAAAAIVIAAGRIAVYMEARDR